MKSRQQKRPDGVDTSDESDGDAEEVIVAKPTQKNKARVSVSAEAFGAWNKKTDYKPKVVEKSSDQMIRLETRLSQAFMFSALDEKEKDIVIRAMEEVKFKYFFIIKKLKKDLVIL